MERQPCCCHHVSTAAQKWDPATTGFHDCTLTSRQVRERCEVLENGGERRSADQSDWDLGEMPRVKHWGPLICLQYAFSPLDATWAHTLGPLSSGGLRSSFVLRRRRHQAAAMHNMVSPLYKKKKKKINKSEKDGRAEVVGGGAEGRGYKNYIQDW